MSHDGVISYRQESLEDRHMGRECPEELCHQVCQFRSARTTKRTTTVKIPGQVLVFRFTSILPPSAKEIYKRMHEGVEVIASRMFESRVATRLTHSLPAYR